MPTELIKMNFQMQLQNLPVYITPQKEAVLAQCKRSWEHDLEPKRVLISDFKAGIKGNGFQIGHVEPDSERGTSGPCGCPKQDGLIRIWSSSMVANHSHVIQNWARGQTGMPLHVCGDELPSGFPGADPLLLHNLSHGWTAGGWIGQWGSTHTRSQPQGGGADLALIALFVLLWNKQHIPPDPAGLTGPWPESAVYVLLPWPAPTLPRICPLPPYCCSSHAGRAWGGMGAGWLEGTARPAGMCSPAIHDSESGP